MNRVDKIYWSIFALGAVLRLIDLGHAELWYDEAFSAWVASLPVDHLLIALSGDTHPPLYYLLLHSLVSLGLDSDFWLRVPSTLFSLAAIPLLYGIGYMLRFSDVARLGAVGFMAISSAQIHYAQEARMYTLFQAEILLVVLLILRRSPVGVFLAMLTALYTHNYALIYGPVLALILYARERKITSLWPLCTAVFFWLPWAGVLVGQMRTISGGYWIQQITWGAQVYALYMQFLGFATPDQWKIVTVISFLSVTFLACVRVIQTRHTGGLMMLALGLAPLSLAIIVSIGWVPILLFRALLPSSGALYLICAYVLTRGPRWQTAYAAMLVLPLTLSGLFGHYRYNPINKGDLKTLVALMRLEWQPGDLILHINDSTVVTFHRYAHDLRPQYKLSPCEQEPLGSLSTVTRAGLGIVEISSNDLPDRYWIVWADSPVSPACEEQAAQTLIANARLYKLELDSKLFYGGVWVYDKNQVRSP
ncbi:MAG: hypothetical protein NWE95_13705 [Candidatus Bathyarchaeota archaeon]|nr:hypothetical protein [Candidatus Bathyarchaeota archaeon]